MDNALVGDDSSERDYHSSPRFSMQRSILDTDCSTPGGDSESFSRTFSQISISSEQTGRDGSSVDSSPAVWPIKKPGGRLSVLTKLRMKQHSEIKYDKTNEEASNSDMELVKERFSKLLLGEDMSGGGKGVCSAVALSNAITNLYATVFSQFWKLEPLSNEKRSMWKREMDLLLSVCDFIVEFFPSSQTTPDGSTVEVMTTRPRSDIYANLPALEKLDSMLLDILDSFEKTEFWYVDGDDTPRNATGSRSFGRLSCRNEEKWWLPVPFVPQLGLSEKARKELHKKRDCANQIQKAAMAINDGILAEMEVPKSYIATLPKTGRIGVGDAIYNYMMKADNFSADYLLDCLDVASEHEALELADQIEAGMHVWRRKAGIMNMKSSWDMGNGDKNQILATRAESLLLSLKQRYPGLSQTTLDMCKIQYNKDVGQAILESYSRVLESLAFKLVSWIDDVLYIDSVVRDNHPLQQR